MKKLTSGKPEPRGACRCCVQGAAQKHTDDGATIIDL